MHKPLVMLALLLALFLGPRNASSMFLTNNPTADTYFEAYRSEDKNFGEASILRMDQYGGRQIFLRFSLADLPAGKRVLQATLRLYITDVGFNEAGELPDLKTCIGLYDVATPWTEIGLNYNSCDGTKPWNQGPGLPGGKYTDVGPAPKPDYGVHLRQHTIAMEAGKMMKGSWLELDVTDFLRQRQRAGKTEINLLLRSSTLGRNYTFSSREAKDASQHPQLVLRAADTQPDYAVTELFVTDWKPGTKLEVPLKTFSSNATVRPLWAVVQPMPEGNSDAPLLKGTEPHSRLRDWAPAAPGHYRVQCELPAAKAGNASSDRLLWTEQADAYVLSVPPHPRLYVTSERLAKLRENVQSGSRVSKAFLAWVKSGNAKVTQEKFHDMGLNEGCENNAVAWLLTRHWDYLSTASIYAERMLQKPMREHFKDVHAATFLGASWVHSMALFYDYCYDQLTPEHRHKVADWLKEAASWGWVRSGAPIAHNDGGARQCLLGSAALALLGDDPEAPTLYRRSRENFEQHLLPWLNDGGRGGRSGDGGEYEGLHGFFIVKFAWMSQTATGEDVFTQSPFFFNRLRHILFGWYPRRLISPDGSVSMRTYYSPSGDHTRLGYVGDTQPYQSAAALCARFRNTPEAQAVRWLAGDWPTQWMQYCLRWAVLGDFENVPAQEPKELAWFDAGCNTLYARSDWSDDATWVLLENSPYVSVHDSLDTGTFEIFKGDLLAARTGNMDYANVQAKHTLNYLRRSIAANTLLIHDPNEKWKGFIGGAEGIDDGGGQRTNWPLGSGADADTYLNYRDIFQRGQVTRYRHSNDLTYALVDITAAYNNPQFHGGKLNQPKVNSVVRQLLYLRGLDSVLVFDRVSSVKPEFKKSWLLHSLGDLEVLDGQATKVDDGEFHYAGATRAVIRYGWPKPVPSFGRCQSVTLWPEQAQIVKIGGRNDLPEGQTESFPGDQWHGKHRHRHLKDFWVNGNNYPPGDTPETRWFGDPATPRYVPGTPDESGGRGKWRIEVSPAQAAADDVFFHVLSPRLGREGAFPAVSKMSSGAFAGALVTEENKKAAVFFSREQAPQTSFAATLPAGGPWLLVVADLKPGDYRATVKGLDSSPCTIGNDGVLVLPEADGQIQLTPR